MKYIAYCRKSREEQDKQILSIEAQIAELSLNTIVKVVTEPIKIQSSKRFSRSPKR